MSGEHTRLTIVERWIAGIGIVAIAGAAYWLGSLDSRVTQLEKVAGEVAMGPRGQNCQQIVGKLVERPGDQSLRQLADEWNCNGFAASTAERPEAATAQMNSLGQPATANAD